MSRCLSAFFLALLVSLAACAAMLQMLGIVDSAACDTR
jgi:hypothetical protein